MFEISDLKSKKLPELQEIAKGLNIAKFKTLKKLDLVYQILDVQASNPKIVQETAPTNTMDTEVPKAKRSRIVKDKPKAAEKNNPPVNKTEGSLPPVEEKDTLPVANIRKDDQKKDGIKPEGKVRPQHNNGPKKMEYPKKAVQHTNTPQVAQQQNNTPQQST